MSDVKSDVNKLDETTTRPTPQRRKWLRVIAWVAGSVFGLLVLLVVGVSVYSTTDDFQRRVGGEVKSSLEEAMGGKVDVGHIAFSLWHLAVEVDGLVIHGTEGPGEAPYLSADKIFVRVQIHTFLSHTVGKGAQSHIGLNFLRVEQPHYHLIVDKDGNTNQPVPKHPSTSTEPIQDTLLDLQAGTIELANGLAVVNDKAIPFDLAAENLNVGVKYNGANDRYGISLGLDNLRTKMAKQPEVASKLQLTAQIGRDMASLDSFDFTTGAKTELKANAQVEHFARPEWQLDLNGAVELKQVGYLADLDGFSAGIVNLDVHGRNCVVTPQVAQKNPRFWQRHNKQKLPPDVKILPPDPDCKAGYLMVGNVKAKGVNYRIPNVRLHDVDAAAQLRVTPTEMLFTAITSTLPGGGKIAGEMKIENWLGEVATGAPAASATAVAAAKTANTTARELNANTPVKTMQLAQVSHAHAYLTVLVSGISLRTILEVTGPDHYGDLGFDTSISGPVKVEWGGSVSEISSSVLVDANLDFTPTGQKARGYPSNIPLTGKVLGHYDGSNQTVRIASLNLNTPQSSFTVSGLLGVNNGDPLTNLNVNFTDRDLSEYDQLLQTLGFQSNGKKGSAAIPVVLHGTMNFNGTAKGAVHDLDVKGHLGADNLAVQLGSTADVHIDSVVADAEYSPSRGVAVGASTIKRGTAVLNVTGSFVPRRVYSKRGKVVGYAWDGGTTLDTGVKLVNAQVADLLDIAGQQKKIPLTGTIDVDTHLGGTVANLNGSGNVTLKNGVAYGENYQTVALDFTMQGQDLNATKLLVQAHDMAVTGSAGYNLTTKHIKANLNGANVVLSKLDTVQKANLGADGTLTFALNADGTVTEPNLHANLKLANVTVQGKPVGDLAVTANSAGSVVKYELTSNLIGAQLAAAGTTELTGQYETQAKITLSGLDLANVIATFAPGTMKASSAIAGTITVSGPAADPTKLAGVAEFGTFDLKMQGVELKSAEPLKAELHDGLVTIDSLHITGDQTDLHAGGTVRVFGDSNPQGGQMNLTATGSINTAIAHTLDPDLITSGKVTFDVVAGGRTKKPSLTGNVKFQNVNAAVDGVANGLSQMNGTLVFNEDRLDVQNLTAMTGGGQLKIGGSLTYQKGIFADLTATGDAVRVRLNGLSATATTALRLQGGPQSVLLSGTVLITRFGVGADVDFAAFAGTGGVSLPPDPNAAANKIRMDVHVTSSPQLDFQNSYAKLAGSVDLTVRGTVAVPSILGRINITDGSATFAGTKYTLDRGSIYFSNPVRIDPTVDLDVSTRVENYDITIGIHGTTTSLVPTYRSSPPLTEADIFNLLALGRTQEEAQLNTEQQTQAGTDPTTSALLGGALNATVSSRVNKLFGGGSVKIDPAFVGTLGGSTARITVVEPLSKQVTLTFATNVNQTAQQLIQVQYQIDDNTSLVATRDESGVFSIVYKIRKRYK